MLQASERVHSGPKVLVVEDCDLTVSLITELIELDHPDVNLTITWSREKARQLLSQTSDYNIVFLDWNLTDGTSKGLIELIYWTQNNVIEIVGISWDKDFRLNTQVRQEGATSECEKFEVPDKIGEIKRTFYLQ